MTAAEIAMQARLAAADAMAEALPESLYGSEQWCAAIMGVSYESWRKNVRLDLEALGFPKRNPVTGMRVKAHVIAWVNK
jgi:hypothetical protein